MIVPRPAAGDPAAAPGQATRRGAAALLAGVLDRGRTLADQLGDAEGPLARLEAPERARAQTLATGTLRHLGRVDAVLAVFLATPPPAAARNTLRLAVTEMLLDHVPPHAAVDGAVRLVRAQPGAARLAGLVNAVARRVAVEGRVVWEASPEAPLPDWLAGPVRAAYGEDALTGIAIAHARGAPPPVDLTLREPEKAHDWAARLDAMVLPTGSLRLPYRTQISALAGYESGAWWVQDAAAAVPARMLGDVRGLRVLDLCAAPGGKTLQLAAAGARVTALDASGLRLRRLEQNLARMGLEAEIITADAREWQPDRAYDAVLVDAPCTASGTIRRHPDLPHVRAARELAPLLELQAALFARAWDWLAPGGRLVWCTCSLLPAEGEEQVAHFRARAPEAVQRRPQPEALGIEPGWLDMEGGLRLRPDFWQDIGGMDGFYAALLEKPADAA